VEYECSEEGVVALTFEVIDSGEGPYHLEFHHICYTAALEDKLKTSSYWSYWLRKKRIQGGFPVEDDPFIKRGPGAFPKGDGEIDDIEQMWIRFMAISLVEKLQCDVIAHPTTRGSYPFGRVPYEFLLKEPS
jgi:hypothetical protein